MAGPLILVIDDEPDIVDFLTTLFEDHGFETRFAHDGQSGMARARERPPDLITLDITMPGKSGVAVFKELRTDPVLCRVPVFIITGVHEFRQMMLARSVLPPEGYMEKPVDPDILVAGVKRILKVP
jgi:DNA-binding response OmpR family regulator